MLHFIVLDTNTPQVFFIRHILCFSLCHLKNYRRQAYLANDVVKEDEASAGLASVRSHASACRFQMATHYKHTRTGHLVPSSLVRPLATSMVAILHFCCSLESRFMMLIEGHFMFFRVSSHPVLGLPRLLFPLIPPSITSFSIARSPHNQNILTLPV